MTLPTALTKTLNAAQKDAVETLEGPVMVVAGPGTGKTHVLTLRIANILKSTDTPPDGILALTFTESGATTMRRRLASIVGSSAYRVRIHTFHGYCKDVIDRYPEEFPRIIGADPIAEIEKIDVLSTIITEGTWEHLKPYGNPLYYLHPLKSAISELKRENISPDALSTYLVREQKEFNATEDLYHDSGVHKGKMRGKYQTLAKRIERTVELHDVYEAYEKELAARRLYDFDDMIMEAIKAMEQKPDLLLRLQEESLYILADEHQDANASQNKLLELLGNHDSSPNLFVVGDEKQAIFRFQGASLDNFAYFKKLFPTAKLVVLTESYRSGQEILDVAHSLASARKEESEHSFKPVPLVSKAKVEKSNIELRAFSKPEYERTWLAEDIERLIGEGVEPAEIAVLFRTNGEANDIAAALEARKIAVSIESDQNALHDPEIRKFITYLRAVAYFGDDELLASALHLHFTKMTALDVYKVMHYSRRNDLLAADVLHDVEKLKEAKLEHPEIAHEVYATIEKFAKHEGSVSHIVEAMIEESGFLASVLSGKHAIETLGKLGGLVRDIETLTSAHPDYSLRALAEHLALLDEHRIPIRKENRAAGRKGAVRLMTAHRSKGMEFEHVYVVNVGDGVWGGRRETTLFDLPTGAASGSDEDERRLLYVALTRAKLAISVSYSRENATGSERLKSRLLEDIDPKFIAEISTQEYEAKLGDHVAEMMGGRKRRAVALPDETQYLQELFIEQGLSVTALNNFLNCPWRYFYSNLIRIPKTPTKSLVFGTAAHAALRRFFDTRTKGDEAGKKELLEWFVDAMRRAPLSRFERTETEERGKKFLDGWYDTYHAVWPKESKTEYRLQMEMSVDELPGGKLRLRGDLDKIEFNNGGGVNVVDYKTGQPKSRNEIQGNTKNGTGEYWRQLVFYKMLLDMEGKYTMKTGELDFLQPDDRGKYHIERFDILPADVDALKDIVKQAALDIYNLTFWDTYCDDPACEYCTLRRLMH